MATYGRDDNENGNGNGRPRPPLNVREMEQGIESSVARDFQTKPPLNTMRRPDEFAPPAVRDARPRSLDELRSAGKQMAETMAKQYLGAAEAILQTGREYMETQNKLAQALIEEAAILTEEGQAVFKQYEAAAEEYKKRAAQLSIDIENAANKREKAVELCQEMIKVLAETPVPK